VGKTKLNPKILKHLKNKTHLSEGSIRSMLSRIRSDYSVTLNAAAHIFAQKRGFGVSRNLSDKDRASLKTVQIEKIRIPASKLRKKKKIIRIAKYKTEDKLLEKHLEEINKTYTYGCYTACFILCRKLLENLLIHHILLRKYPSKKRESKEKYFDFNNNRYLDFNRIISNLRKSSSDFGLEKKLVERICQLSENFKETANNMTHSLFHIASKKEIDEKQFQDLLYLIEKLESTL